MAKDSTKVKERKHFMNGEDTHKMGDLPRTHQNCFDKTGKNRPGKTAKDRANRGL